MSPTPILDLERMPPTPKGDALGVYGLMWLCGGFLALLVLVAAAFMPELPALNPLLMVPALYFAIAIHEAGHLIAGKLAGLTPGGIGIGAFQFLRSDDRWIFRFDRRRLFSGWAMPLISGSEIRVGSFAWMVAGGPIASLLLVVVCAIGVKWFGSGAWLWLGSLFWASAPILLSLIPAGNGLAASDGARLWHLLRHKDKTSAWIGLLALVAQEMRGIRPRDWDAGLVHEALETDPGLGEYSYRQLLAYYRCLDEGDESSALEHLENALAQCAGAGLEMRQRLYLEASLASARIRRRADRARIWLDWACKIRKPESTASADAAIAICERRFDEALQHLAAVRNRLDCIRRESGFVLFAKEHWAEQEKVCRTELAAKTTEYQ